MSKKLQKIIGSLMTLTLFISTFAFAISPANAKIVFKNEFLIDDNGSDTFIIDAADDVTGNVKLQFGNSLAETISFDTVNSWFDFSDDINLNQYQIKNAVLDNSATAPASPVVGQIYYNTVNNNTYVYNGTIWEDITATGGSGNDDLDSVYTTDADKIMNVNDPLGLEFNSTVTSDIIFDLQNTGDVVFQDAGTTFAALNDSGLLDLINAEDLERIRLTDTTNGDSVGLYTGLGDPEGVISAEAGSLYLDQSGQLYINQDGSTHWEISSDNSLDEAYDKGGPGAGRTINADNGAVQIIGDGLEVDNLKTDDNTISSINLNGNINLDPNGTGFVNLNAATNIGGNLNMNLYEILSARAENLSSAPTCNAGSTGRFYTNTSDSQTYVCDGANWKQMNAQNFDQVFAESVADGDTILNITNGNALEIQNDSTSGFIIDLQNTGDLEIQDAGATFLTVTNTGELRIDNLQLDGNSLTSTNLNGNITIDPNGTGFVNLGADVNIDGNNVVLDYDNSGGNIALQFGQALAESLIWDSANTRFTLSNNTRIEGNAAVIGQAYIADDHTATDSDGTINLGLNGSTWETLKFNSTTDQFEVSDDVNVSGNLGLGTTTPSFNFHLYDDTSTASHEWQVFDNGTDQVSVFTGTQDPTLVATDGDTGSIFLNTSTGKIYIKTDDGSTVNWEQSGLSADLLDALDGTYGTPSAANKFVTSDDPRLATTGGSYGEISLGTHLDYSATNQSVNNSYIYYTRIFLPADTDVNSFAIFTVQSVTGNVNYGLYSDNSGVPYTKLAEVGVTASTSPVDDYWEYSLSTPYNIANADFYWLAYASDKSPKAHQFLGAEDVFVPFRVESKLSTSAALPAIATPDTQGSSYNLPFLAGFE